MNVINSVFNTKSITEVDDSLLEFLSECDKLGFNNNNSLESMKFQWCLDEGGMWYATYCDDKIISISGIHPWTDGYRALFRGAQLYPRDIGLNRYHMQSFCFHSQLPLQIEYALQNNSGIIYVTTNVDNDNSGKMTRINRTFHHLEKFGLVTGFGTVQVYDVDQSIWMLDIAKYNEVRYDTKD